MQPRFSRVIQDAGFACSFRATLGCSQTRLRHVLSLYDFTRYFRVNAKQGKKLAKAYLLLTRNYAS